MHYRKSNERKSGSWVPEVFGQRKKGATALVLMQVRTLASLEPGHCHIAAMLLNLVGELYTIVNTSGTF